MTLSPPTGDAGLWEGAHWGGRRLWGRTKGTPSLGSMPQRKHKPAPQDSAERKFPKSIWLLSVSAGNMKSTKKLHEAAQINISNFLRPC